MATSSIHESHLAKAFDDLADSTCRDLSFREEASIVARFTKLYIQNLFSLNESEFKDFMRKHRDLHARALRCERRGENSDLILLQQRLSGDILGRILERYKSHFGALDCILDIKATASLVHHLVRQNPSEKLPKNVLGCEFGAGTGVLSVAGIIPFLRRGKTVVVHAFEQSQECREDAQRIVEILTRESRYKDRIQIFFHDGDVTSEEPYRMVESAEEQYGPMSLWISETFGYQSKKPVVSEDGSVWDFVDPAGVIPYDSDLEKLYDPLPIVLSLSARFFENFFQRIKAGEIIAFPDFITPQVIIDGQKSALLTADGHWRSLGEIGEPYNMLPHCIPTRWYCEKKSEKKSEKTPTKKKVPLSNKLKKNKKKKKYYCR